MYGIPYFVRRWNKKFHLHLDFSRQHSDICTRFYPKIFWEKVEFSINFLLYLTLSAVRMNQIDAYHLNWEVHLAMWMTVGFDASFNSEWTFFWIFRQKNPKHSFLRLVDNSKEISSCCANNKKKLGFVKFIGLLREAVVSFSGMLGCRKLVWSKYFGCRALLFNCFCHLRWIYCSSHHLDFCLKSVCLLKTLSISSVFIWFWVCANNFLFLVFWQKLSEKMLSW